MKKTILIIRPLLITLFILVLSGCSHKKDCKGFAMQYIDWLHYGLNDQIVFKDQYGDLRIYIVTKKYVTYPYTEKWNDWNGKELSC